MAISKNLPILKNHFRKHWQERVKVHFDQAGKKASRRQSRLQKVAKVSPKPVDTLKPIIRCPTIKYNRKLRAGRGFTLAELKAVGLTPKYARTIGISVDHRRVNRNEETFELNVKRLNDYKSKLVVFDKKTTKEEIAKFNSTTISSEFPIAQSPVESAPRKVEVGEETAFRTLRLAKSDKKYKGIRAKRAQEKADAEAEKKKK